MSKIQIIQSRICKPTRDLGLVGGNNPQTNMFKCLRLELLIASNHVSDNNASFAEYMYKIKKTKNQKLQNSENTLHSVCPDLSAWSSFSPAFSFLAFM